MMTSKRHWTRVALAVVLGFAPAVAVAQQQRPQQQPQQQRPAAAPAAPAAPVELPPKGTNIVIVDLLAIERDSQAFQSIRQQFERQRTSQQAEVAKLEAELRTAEEDLAKQRAILSPDAYTQRRRDLEKRVGDAQQRVQSRRRDLEQTFSEAGNRVMTNVQQLIIELAEENQYQIVIPRNQVIAVRGALDVTPEVLKRLNRKLPTVNVSVPAAR